MEAQVRSMTPMTDSTFWFLLLVMLTGAAGLGYQVVLILRGVISVAQDALNGCARDVR
jgi:hypothetical protein